MRRVKRERKDEDEEQQERESPTAKQSRQTKVEKDNIVVEDKREREDYLTAMKKMR